MCNQKYKYKKHEKKLRRAINYLLTRVIDGGHSWEKPSERPGKSNPFNSILYFVYFTYFFDSPAYSSKVLISIMHHRVTFIWKPKCLEEKTKCDFKLSIIQSHMARLARLAVLRSVIHFHRLHIHSEIRYVPVFPQNHHQCERYHPPTGYNRSCLASLGCGSDQAREKAEKRSNR